MLRVKYYIVLMNKSSSANFITIVLFLFPLKNTFIENKNWVKLADSKR